MPRRRWWRNHQPPSSPAHSPALTFSRNRPFDRRALRPLPRGVLGNTVHPRGLRRQDSAKGLQGPACIAQPRAYCHPEKAGQEEERPGESSRWAGIGSFGRSPGEGIGKGLLPSKASCQQRGSCLDPGE
ncbi:dexamethasone-induced protein isoform X2 [Trachypithecus francoisi]|uniref:dexamethasone-induced protein isoform X2 n=1 Tax=Trachypithecus francoisi TaxID=54180 RepID=UPI00141B4764|nr:dexamethasone-induced protein isoform X2 [Trachypithecus francoisi]